MRIEMITFSLNGIGFTELLSTLLYSTCERQKGENFKGFIQLVRNLLLRISLML